jgi:hypothetical protein
MGNGRWTIVNNRQPATGSRSMTAPAGACRLLLVGLLAFGCTCCKPRGNDRATPTESSSGPLELRASPSAKQATPAPLPPATSSNRPGFEYVQGYRSWVPAPIEGFKAPTITRQKQLDDLASKNEPVSIWVGPRTLCALKRPSGLTSYLAIRVDPGFASHTLGARDMRCLRSLRPTHLSLGERNSNHGTIKLSTDAVAVLGTFDELLRCCRDAR